MSIKQLFEDFLFYPEGGNLDILYVKLLSRLVEHVSENLSSLEAIEKSLFPDGLALATGESLVDKLGSKIEDHSIGAHHGVVCLGQAELYLLVDSETNTDPSMVKENQLIDWLQLVVEYLLLVVEPWFQTVENIYHELFVDLVCPGIHKVVWFLDSEELVELVDKVIV